MSREWSTGKCENSVLGGVVNDLLGGVENGILGSVRIVYWEV